MHAPPRLLPLLTAFLLGTPLGADGLYLKPRVFGQRIRNGTDRHLVSEPSPAASAGGELGCGLSNLKRFYHTLGRYPGHRRLPATAW